MAVHALRVAPSWHDRQPRPMLDNGRLASRPSLPQRTATRATTHRGSATWCRFWPA